MSARETQGAAVGVLPPAGRRGGHPFERAFEGITPERVATAFGLCLIWATSNSVQELPFSWQEHLLDEWLLSVFGGNLACMVLTAHVLAIPLVVVGNLGPQDGWRRYGLLVLTIALAAIPASGVRFGYLLIVSDFDLSGFNLGNWIAWWTRYAQFAALFTVVIEFQRRETRSLENLHRAEIDRIALEREMDEARLQVLQAQIEPHFLFNTLANVRRLYQTDPASGRAMMDNLMRYLEVALPHMRESRSTVGRELALVEAYLNVQRIRMGRRLAFEVDVPPALRGLELPPMMLLTLVENAIKHGLSALPDGGFIRITAQVDAGQLRVEVADSGRGFQASSGGGTGLANIRARLAAMHGADAALTLAENRPRGVTSTLILPSLAREPS